MGGSGVSYEFAVEYCLRCFEINLWIPLLFPLVLQHFQLKSHQLCFQLQIHFIEVVRVPEFSKIENDGGPQVWLDPVPIDLFMRETLIISIFCSLYQVLVLEEITFVLFMSAKLKEPWRSKVKEQTHLCLFWLSD